MVIILYVLLLIVNVNRNKLNVNFSKCKCTCNIVIFKELIPSIYNFILIDIYIYIFTVNDVGFFIYYHT